MNSIWASLLWKEWREHRLIIAALGVLAIVVPVAFSIRHPANVVPAVTFCLFTIPAFSMFLGMHIAGREQSTGTIRFLQSLPISGRRAAAAKLLWAAACIVVPVLLMVVTAALWVRLLPGSQADSALLADHGIYSRETSVGAWYTARILVPILTGISILVWMAASGVNRSDEVRAGAIGFLVMIAYWGLIALFGYLVTDRTPRPNVPFSILRTLMATAAGGITSAIEGSFTQISTPRARDLFWSRNWFVIAAAVLANGGLAAWYIGRFGRVAAGRPQPAELSASSAAAATWLAPPMRSPFRAILWKQFRESAPLAIMAAGFIGICLLVAWVGQQYQADRSALDLLHIAAVLWMMIGFMVATVAGVGVFLDDLRPGLHTFWRSRPIHVDQWFAVKFIVGLLSTIITLAIPLALAAAYAWAATDRLELKQLVQSRDALGMVAMGLLLQVGFYTTAVLAMVLMRQPIYAAVAALAAVGISAALGGWVLDEFGRLVDWTDQTAVVAALTLFALSVAGSIAIAGLAVRRDWGWKK